MEFGINAFPIDFGISPGDLRQALEALGLESLFFVWHTYIPASRRSKFPYAHDINRDYCHNLDPFIALANAASATWHLLLGTGTCLVVQPASIILARHAPNDSSELQQRMNTLDRMAADAGPSR